MKTFKFSILILSIIAILLILLLFFVNCKLNKAENIDLANNMIISIFGSSLVSLIYSIISYLLEKQKITNDLIKYFKLSTLSLKVCSHQWKQAPIIRIREYEQCRMFLHDFFQTKMVFSPIFKKAKNIQNITMISDLLSQIQDDVVSLDNQIFSTYNDSNADFEKVFSEMGKIYEKYKNKILKFMNLIDPDFQL